MCCLLRRAARAAGFVCLLAGCRGDAPPPMASQALLDGLPVAPASARIEAAGGPDAVEARYRSGLPADSVAAWYRRWFLDQGWRIRGDARLPDGTTVVHAERDGRPVWLMTRRFGQAGSIFSLVGAEPGTAPAGR